MRPVRFVALSEDGMSLILTDEVGRMLSLTIDDSVASAIRAEAGSAGQLAIELDASLTPRDIQARIRAGDSVSEVARLANVPIEKVLRFAGPVLQERAAIVQLARRTRLKTSDNGAALATVADTRLREHGIDPETVAWDSYRRDTGTWRVAASWQSGKATARAVWDLDKARSVITPVDDMAQFLSRDRQALLAAEEPAEPAKPKLAAASKIFADDDDSEPREGPVVPAISMLRREKRDKKDRVTAGPAPTVAPDGLSAARDGVAVGVTSSTEAMPGDGDQANANVDAARAVMTAAGDTAGVDAHASLDSEQLPVRKPAKGALPTWDDILFGSR